MRFVRPAHECTVVLHWESICFTPLSSRHKPNHVDFEKSQDSGDPASPCEYRDLDSFFEARGGPQTYDTSRLSFRQVNPWSVVDVLVNQKCRSSSGICLAM